MSPGALARLKLFLQDVPFALVSNHSTRSSTSLWTAEALVEGGLTPTTLYTPEHGADLGGQEDEAGEEGFFRSIPIRSLYKKGGSIAEWLDPGLENLLFDLKTTGTRCFTYISLLLQIMVCAQERGFRLVVVNRENPLGTTVAGPDVEEGFQSYVGLVPVPFQYGLNLGDLAVFLYQKQGWSFPLVICPDWGDVGEPYYPLSPNLNCFEALKFYPATVFLEGLTLSEGRGTPYPFRQFGAPDFPAGNFVNLAKETLPAGFLVSPTTFVPLRSKFANRECSGIRIESLPSTLPAFASGLYLYSLLFRHFPNSFEFVGRAGEPPFFNKLMGCGWVLRDLQSGRPIADILETLEGGNRAFARDAGKILNGTTHRDETSGYLTLN